MKLQLVFFIFFLDVALVSSMFDNFHKIRANTTSARYQMQAVEECPLLVSANLPFDYTDKYNSILPIDFIFSIYRFVEIDDLQQSVTVIGDIQLSIGLEDCGFYKGPELQYTLSGTEQWVPGIAHDNAKDHFDLTKR